LLFRATKHFWSFVRMCCWYLYPPEHYISDSMSVYAVITPLISVVYHKKSTQGEGIDKFVSCQPKWDGYWNSSRRDKNMSNWIMIMIASCWRTCQNLTTYVCWWKLC
jgi:hypothetical protein